MRMVLVVAILLLIAVASVSTSITPRLKGANRHTDGNYEFAIEMFLEGLQPFESAIKAAPSTSFSTVNPAVSLESTSTTFGWVYNQFYYSNTCNGTIFGAVGVSTESCLPFNSTSSFSVSFTQADCSDLMLTTYNDTKCQSVSSVLPLSQNVSQCFGEQVYQARSFELLCKLGTAIPVNQDSIAFSLYLNDSSCATQPKEYVSFSTDICASGFGFENFTVPIKSLTATCTSTGFTLHGYPQSTDCTGIAFSQTFSDVCKAVQNSQANRYLGNFSVDGECFVFNTPMPTRSPTHRPSQMPTMAPTVNYVRFDASQTITGINITTYMSNQTAYALTLTNSIASCMTEMTTENIINLVVYDPTATVTTTRRVLASSGNKITANYTVSTTAAGVTYSSLSSQLSTNIANGVFNQYLNQYSVIYNTAGFVNATSGSVFTTNDLSPPSNNDDGSDLSDGAIAGIVIGSLAGVVLIWIASYYYIGTFFKKGKTTTNTVSVDGVSKTQMSDLGSSNASFVGDDGKDNIVHNALFASASAPAVPVASDTPIKNERIQEAIPLER